MLDESSEQVLTALQPYLHGCAKKVLASMDLPGTEREDLVQFMNIQIIERALDDPEFLTKSTKSYVGKFAAWRARDHLISTWFTKTHGKGIEEQILDAETDEDCPMVERIPAPQQDLDLAGQVRDIIADLEGRTQEVAVMMLQGFKRREIAQHFGIKSQSLSGDVNRIKDALSVCVA